LSLYHELVNGYVRIMFSGQPTGVCLDASTKALHAVIANLFDIPLRANYRADFSRMYIHVFLKTRLQLLMTMDESRTQVCYPYVLRKRISCRRNRNEWDRTSIVFSTVSRILALYSNIRTSLIRQGRLHNKIIYI